MILSICDVPDVLKVMRLIKIVITIIKIAVPIILIISVMIDYAKAVTSDDNDLLRKANTLAVKKAIGALLVFFIPTFVSIIANVILPENDYISCFKNATDRGIQSAYETKMSELIESARKNNDMNSYSVARNYLSNITDPDLKEKYSKELEQIYTSISSSQSSGGTGGGSSTSSGSFSGGSLSPIVVDESGKEEQRALRNGECMNTKCKCPNYNDLGGYEFTMASATGRDFSWHNQGASFVSVNVSCLNKSVRVHEKYSSNFKNAFDKMCDLKNSGKITEITDIGTLVIRLNSPRTICSLHSYGVAVDINTNKTITVNGTAYRPYIYNPNSKSAYNSFVQALGKESDSRNEIYTIWKEAFEPNGFTWGGLWSDQNDPGHFEIR